MMCACVSGNLMNEFLTFNIYFDIFTETLYKFDGVIHKEPTEHIEKNFFKRVKNYFFVDSSTKAMIQDGKQDCEIYAHYFAANHLTFDNPSCLNENLDKCRLLHYQFRKIYQIDGGYYNTEAEFRKMVLRVKNFPNFALHVA